MTEVTVTPEAFTMVHFDAGVIAGIGADLAERLGLSDDTLSVVVDESSPLARSRVASDDPLTFEIEGGSFEDTRRPRNLSEARTADTLGRLILKTLDRRSPDFGDPPPADELTLAQTVAWDVYTVGRLVRRAGLAGQRQRRVYQFRNRHGFTDTADAAFDELWNADDLTWAQINEISDRAQAVATA